MPAPNVALLVIVNGIWDGDGDGDGNGGKFLSLIIDILIIKKLYILFIFDMYFSFFFP